MKVFPVLIFLLPLSGVVDARNNVGGNVNTQATTNNENLLSFSIGAQTYLLTYEEPGVMQHDGWIYGLSYSIAYQRKLIYKVEGMVATGQVDYSSVKSGSIENQVNVITENRGIIEYPIYNTSGVMVATLFSGMGYRFLSNESKGRTSTTNNWGYDRRSHYLYSPIGANINFNQTTQWQLKASLEYDYFWYGAQESDLGYKDGYDDIVNYQNTGYGYRFSFAFQRHINPTLLISIEPFYRYWNIDNSDTTTDSSNRTWLEPTNETTESGVNISVFF